MSLGPPPNTGLDQIDGWGTIPTLEQLGLKESKASQMIHSVSQAMPSLFYFKSTVKPMIHLIPKYGATISTFNCENAQWFKKH